MTCMPVTTACSPQSAADVAPRRRVTASPSHCSHAVAPVWFWNDPCGQRTHCRPPASAMNDPAGHGSHGFWPVGEKYPGSHLLSSAAARSASSFAAPSPPSPLPIASTCPPRQTAWGESHGLSPAPDHSQSLTPARKKAVGRTSTFGAPPAMPFTTGFSPLGGSSSSFSS